MEFGLTNRSLSSTDETPKVAWDGVHIFLRYQSQFDLYYASINRRDNTVVIKKKVKGGPDNGGTYYELSDYVPYDVPYGKWQQIRATVKNNPDGSVTLALYADDKLLVSATDTGKGGPPITAPGKTGIRSDNAEIEFRDFTVRSLTTKVGQILWMGARDALVMITVRPGFWRFPTLPSRTIPSSRPRRHTRAA